jgi:excisionase family DNA binding protein
MDQNTTSNGVLTLAEAAKFLRVKKTVLQKLAQQGRVPPRKVGNAWRFSRAGLDEWLRGEPDSRSIFLSQVGAFKDDETLMPMLEEIYNARSRPMVEDQDEK